MKKGLFLLCITGSLSLATAYANSVNIVWQIDPKTYWEGDWVTELLNGMDLNLNMIDDGQFKVFVDNSIVVVTTAPQNSAYFKKLRAMKYKYGIILVGDEKYDKPTDFYQHAQFVFRNYWHKKFSAQKNVYFIPLGYKTGFWKHCSREVKKAQDRTYIWSFAGQLTGKPTRTAMIQAMRHIPHHYVHETFIWDDKNSLPVDQYQNMLLDSIFAPSPIGWWNLDSFRVYEALECGCIPIVEKQPIDYFTLYFGNHPFIAVDTWNQVPDVINKLIADPVRLEQYRNACHEWWLQYKNALKQQLATVVKNTLKT